MLPERIAVVGASGYGGEELLRILLTHPSVEIACVTSRQHEGEALHAVHPRLSRKNCAGLRFSSSKASAVLESGVRFAFLALPHGVSAEFAVPLREAGIRLIDLSADFRIKDAAVYEEFYRLPHSAPQLLRTSVYGLPELNRKEIAAADLVAAPGCYPTSILLPLCPLLRRGLLDPREIIVTSMSGVSGAGRKAETAFLFAECNESVRAYGIPKHRHLAEIEQELTAAASQDVVINFAPHLVPMNRGISTTIHARPRANVRPGQVGDAWHEAYDGETFVRLLESPALPDTKNVTGTNFADLAWRWDGRTGRVVLLSALDNLVKGAAGQAVQCLNLMAGWPEETGLS